MTRQEFEQHCIREHVFNPAMVDAISYTDLVERHALNHDEIWLSHGHKPAVNGALVGDVVPVVPEEDLAFDGSNEPQKRDLTARERGMLCTVLSDIRAAAKQGRWSDLQAVLRTEPNDLPALMVIRDVIDPRED